MIFRVRLVAGFQLRQDDIDIGLAKHGQLPHVPVVTACIFRFSVFNTRVPALVYNVLDLGASRFLAQGRQVGKSFKLAALCCVTQARVLILFVTHFSFSN